MTRRSWMARATALVLAFCCTRPGPAQPGQTRRILDARQMVGMLDADAGCELVLPSPFAADGARRPAATGAAGPTGGELLVDLVRTFCGETLALQVVDRGLLIATGTQEQSSLANSVLLALNSRGGAKLALTASCTSTERRRVPTVQIPVEELQRFEVAARGADFQGHAGFDDLVGCGIVALAPKHRLMVWHGFRATVRGDRGTASVWAHGSALLSLEDELLVTWTDPVRRRWSLRQVNASIALPPQPQFRALPLGPLLRRANSPRPLRLGAAQRAAEPEDPAVPALDRVQEILLVKEPTRSALGRARLRIWRDLALVGAEPKDAEAIATAIERAADVPQVRIEIRFGALAGPALAAVEKTGDLDPEAAAGMRSAEVPSVLGEPFGIAFVEEADGSVVRGLELEGLPLARSDREVALVARLAIVPALVSGPAASRPAQDKKVVTLREYQWRVLERGSRADGEELVVLVRARPGVQPK